MKPWLNNNGKEGKIRKSNSPATSHIHLIPQPHRLQRIFVDYCRLYMITVTDCCPLLRMHEVRDTLGMAKFFTNSS